MAAQRAIGGATGPNAKLGERGASKGALSGTTCSFPGKGAHPQGGGIPNIIGGVSLPGIFFASGVNNNSKALVPQNVHGCGSKGANPVGFWVLGLSHLRGETGGEI